MIIVKSEKSAASWFWRILLGYAKVADGLVSILSLGYISLGFSYWTARKLIKAQADQKA